MMKKLIVFISILFLVACSDHKAEKPKASQTLPFACNEDGVNYQAPEYMLVSKSKRGRAYFIHNTSEQVVLVNHEKDHDLGVSAGWASTIAPGNWSVILISDPNFNLTCQVPQANDQFVSEPCGKLLTICEPKEQRLLPRAGSGSYWIIENVTMQKALLVTKVRGVDITVN